MRRRGLLFFAILVAAGCATASARAGEYKCPERITVTGAQVTPISGYDGWNDPQVPSLVTGINLYDGHPKGMAQLKPDNADDPNEAEGSVWTLPDSPSGFWMVCVYSDTNVRVIKQLDAHEKFCAVKDIRGPEDNTTPSGGVSLECH